jgi:hypothetical protein
MSLAWCHGVKLVMLAWIRMVRVPMVQDGGWTALHEAASSGHVDAVKALLAAGSDVTATDVRGDAVCVGWQALEVSLCLLSGEVPWSHGV